MRRLIFCVPLLLAACTFQQGADGQMETRFDPPLVYPKWEVQAHVDDKGQKVCSVSTGPKGVSVLLRKRNGTTGVSVASNRPIPLSGALKLNVNGHYYETSQAYFDADDAEKIVQDFMSAEKAYLEWTNDGSRQGRTHVNNILKLDDFAPLFKRCQAKIGA